MDRECCVTEDFSGIDIAVVQMTFLNAPEDESVGPKPAFLPILVQTAPMILNRLELTAEGNALAYGWKADSFAFERLTHHAEIQTWLDRSTGYPVYV